jgi:hypothetical protein
MQKYTSLSYWLPKIPLLSLIGIFLLPLALMQIHYETGLFFIALYISYWSVKVFESYYYVVKSYIKLLRYEKRDFSHDTSIDRYGKDLTHIILLPIYTEPYDVIEDAVVSSINIDKILLYYSRQRLEHQNEKNTQKLSSKNTEKAI